MNTDSLCLALQKKNCIIVYEVGKGKSGNCYTAKTVIICSLQTLSEFILPESVVLNTEKHDKREAGLVTEDVRCTVMLCFCSKTYCCYDSQSNKFKFSIKGLNKRTWTFEACEDEPMANYRHFLNETEKGTFANRGFCTTNLV